MTETVVHVTTLEQWKSVLDVWFNQGYEWYETSQSYHKDYFKDGERYLLLDKDNDILIPMPRKHEPVSYADFMAQQEKVMTKETYYVTQEQLDLIESLKENEYPVYNFYGDSKYRRLATLNKLSSNGEKALLRYIGGDTSIEFKVKETLYRLWRIDTDGDKIYMSFDKFGTPSWAGYNNNAFTASLDEIKKWKTPAWEIEEVK